MAWTSPSPKSPFTACPGIRGGGVICLAAGRLMLEASRANRRLAAAFFCTVAVCGRSQQRAPDGLSQPTRTVTKHCSGRFPYGPLWNLALDWFGPAQSWYGLIMVRFPSVLVHSPQIEFPAGLVVSLNPPIPPISITTALSIPEAQSDHIASLPSLCPQSLAFHRTFGRIRHRSIPPQPSFSPSSTPSSPDSPSPPLPRAHEPEIRPPNCAAQRRTTRR